MSRRHRLSFWTIAATLAVVMAFSSLPSPLYALYQDRDGFSTFTITVIFAAYSVGVVAALFLAGHLSDWYGRKRVLAPAVGASVLSAIVFLVWSDLPGLLIARAINGVSVGVVTATATAYLADLHHNARRAQVVAGAANLGGIGIGPVIGGALAQWAPAPLTLPFVVLLVALLVALLFVLAAPETRPVADPLPSYRAQRVAIPGHARGAFVAALVGAFVGFGVLGLFTGLTGTILAGTLHKTSHVLAGVVIAVVFAGGVVAQTATATWPTRRILSLGVALMPAGLALLATAAYLPSLALFMIGGAAAGAGAGAVFKGAIGTVIAYSEPHARAEALAGLFLSGYLGLTLPVVGAGVALQYLSPQDTLLGFAILVALGIAAAAPRLLGVGERRAVTA